MDRVGSMRDRITIQSFSVTTGTLGGEVRSWTDSFTTWTSVKFLTVGSNERYQSEQLTNRTSVQFMIRKESGTVSPSDRVVFDGLFYEIESVIPTGDRLEFQIIECLQTGEQKTSA